MKNRKLPYTFPTGEQPKEKVQIESYAYHNLLDFVPKKWSKQKKIGSSSTCASKHIMYVCVWESFTSFFFFCSPSISKERIREWEGTKMPKRKKYSNGEILFRWMRMIKLPLMLMILRYGCNSMMHNKKHTHTHAHTSIDEKNKNKYKKTETEIAYHLSCRLHRPTFKLSIFFICSSFSCSLVHFVSFTSLFISFVAHWMISFFWRGEKKW